MSRFRSPPELSKFESPGFKSLQMLSNGPFVFRQRKVRIEGLKQCFGEFASQSSKNSTYMSSDSDINNPVNTWDGIAAVDEPELERMKVSRVFQHKLTSLLRLDIKECPELESIPEGGLPCRLNFIRISSCDKLTPRTEWGMLKLQDLDYFEIEGGCRDLKSFPEKNLLSNSIIKLRISKLQKLEILDYRGFEQLTSLETLMISSCKWLRSLPHHGLSSSLISLYINDCPLLKSKYKNNIVEKKKWFAVDHVPHVQIDDDVIT
ncbi:hypothetical protein LWI29_017664 [Acer saccharum]|uniref:Uncharacterized protein n=1 Tax=Acer saccharum TaxID=4024 RepID=A0AA39RIG0_ACESA|nr:hypothetical protein LWI29_017664 [Acer saccharum]